MAISLVLERGKRSTERTKTPLGFWRKKILNTESKCTVLAKAAATATFSDGKLYSQVKESETITAVKVLNEFVPPGRTR